MKIGDIEVSGIKRIVEGKACWERYPNRWVKYVNGRTVDGMSEQEMHDYLDEKFYEVVIVNPCHGDTYSYRRYRFGIHHDSIDIRKNIRR